MDDFENVVQSSTPTSLDASFVSASQKSHTLSGGWQHLLKRITYDPNFALVDSFPIPVCQFARAYRCRRFKGEAAFCKDTLTRQTFYGFRVHVRLCWPGVITRIALAPANIHKTAVVPDLTAGTRGLLVGDRNYWNPSLREELLSNDIYLQAPFRNAKRDPWPTRSALLSRIRYRIDTVFGQLVRLRRIRPSEYGSRTVGIFTTAFCGKC